MLRTRLAILITLACLGASLASAQRLGVTEAPSKITFDEPKVVGQTEFAQESQVTFPSAQASAFPENDSVRLRIFTPFEGNGPFPCVVLLNFLGAADSALEIEVANELAQEGIASVIMPLPYHLSRTPSGRRSGELAIVPDPAILRETMRQSVFDVRRTVDFISEKPEFDKSRIGLSGTSLGAIVTALVYAIEPRVTCASFNLGGVDLAHTLWSSSIVVAQREELRRKGFTEEKLREALAEIEPLNYLKKEDMRPTYVVVARHDTIIPERSSRELVEAMGNPQILTIETGHYGGFIIQRRLVRTIARFFSLNFRNQKFLAPAKFYSPTIRLGLDLNPETGLQVAAGLDFWRSNPQASTFGSLLVTPRGLSAFLGWTLSQNFAVGFRILPSRTTVGAFWSVVL